MTFSRALPLLAAQLLLLGHATSVRADSHDAGDATSPDVAVTFVVQVPDSTPAGDVLYIAGNVAALGSWDPGQVPLVRQDNRTHQVTLPLPAGSLVEYKLTRGSWETVEKGPTGEEIPNRSLSVAQTETLRIHVARWRDQGGAQVARRPSTIQGDVRHLGRVRSEVLGNERDVWVWLPPSYSQSAGRRYPVVYFHDGQNVFDAATAFVGVEWSADETLQGLAAGGEMREAIAVAVANTPQRVAEYTQARDAQHPVEPGADRYLRFLVEELKPRIDVEFRTRPERDQTVLVGSSLGGLVSLYAGVAAGATFGLVAGVSPVVQWGDHDLERRYRTAPSAERPLRVWIDMGTAEVAGDEVASARLLDELRRFREVLTAVGYVEGRTLGYREAVGAAHNEAAWAARLPDILRFLLPPDPGPAGAGP